MMDAMATILLVEDDPAISRSLGTALELGGYDVVLAADGVEAVTRWRDRRPDAVVLDVGLPVVDGLGVGSCGQTATRRRCSC